MKYLVSGADGQLARAFIRRFKERAIDFLAPEEGRFDITDSASIAGVTESYRPDVIINCAAYNLVDKAEEEREKAFNVNSAGPGLLAYAAKKIDALLVHFGSDYVFDGLKEDGLYTEEDQTNPLNQYGKSKLQGEVSVKKETDAFLMFRLSWVFGEGKQNFIHKLLEWAEDRDYLKATCDEFSVPTYTYTVVDVTLKAIDRGVTGLYNLTNSGFCSRYEWAKLVFRLKGIKKFIRPVPMESFRLPAKRPGFSAMSNEKVSRKLGIEIPSWEEGVENFLLERYGT